MRIGVNARVLLDLNMEGMPRYIYETTTQMALNHPDDEFIMFFDRKVNADFGFPDNVKSVVVPWHARHPIIWHIWLEYMLPVFFRIYKIDVFYSGDGYLSLRSKVPTVLVVHDLAYIHYPQHIQKSSLDHYTKYIPKYLEKAKSIITVSNFVKNDIVQKFNIDSNKIKVAYNAVSPPMDVSDLVLPETISNEIGDKQYFLYVGALHPRKNIINLISGFLLFNAANQNKYKLILAGRLAWKTSEIRDAIASSVNVIQVGMVSESSKYQLIKEALAVTYISLFEGFGIPILEAMKMGTPVISSATTSMPEVAADAAILVDPKNVGEISEAMQRIAKNDALRRDLIKKGNSRYKFFDWKVSAEIIYREICRTLNDSL